MKQLTWTRFLLTLVISCVVCGIAVYLLQLALWPADELACRSNNRALTRAVMEFNTQNAAQPLKANDDVPQAILDRLGIRTKDAEGKEIHYYFLAPSPHNGWMVKCNSHEINPFSLELLGVIIISVIAAVLFLSILGYTLKPGSVPTGGTKGP